MNSKKSIGVFGKVDPLKHRYLNYLKDFFNLTIRQISLPSEVAEVLGVVLLECDEEILWKAVDSDIPIILEIPFASNLDKEIQLLELLDTQRAKVLLPVIATNHIKLIKLRSLIANTSVFGLLQSLHVTMVYDKCYLREEPYTGKRYSGRLVYQLLNLIDIFSSISLQNLEELKVWTSEKNKEVVLMHVRLGEAIGTGISATANIGLTTASPIQVHVEATFSNRIVVWDSTEQSLLLRGDYCPTVIQWYISVDEVIAWRFVTLFENVTPIDNELKRITRSYKLLAEILKKNDEYPESER
jgi:hypothetical protein